MNRSVLRLGLVVLLAVAMSAAPSSLFAQGSTTQTLSGTIVDTTGAVIPGADVSAKHNGTGVVNTAVSNSEGLFSIPSLPIGTYTVSVTLQGFKTVIINNVVLTSSAPANVKATMEIGGVTEQVTVASTSEIVQTQSSTVSQTINTTQITKLPITSRSAMDFVNMLPGVTTANGNRQAVINGLPRGTINITLDGVNVQDNTLRTTDGFFAIVSPRLDAIEEVTVSTAAQGAGDAGQGAIQVKFVTRSGTNAFTGSGYYFQRRDKLNANTWFNNRNGVAKAKLKQDQTGFRAGGPIVIPGLFDGRNRAFFFANYEELRQPSQVTRNNRNVLNTAAQAGNYSYITGGQTVTVNVLQLAANNGQVASVDPIVGKLLTDIRSAVSGGSLSDIDPNLQRFSFNVPVESKRRFPTFRLDYNLNAANRASFAYNYQKFTDFPDTLNNREASFPGFAVEAGQSSVRLGWAGSVRSTLSRNLVNEARLGYSGAPVTFFGELNKGMYANQGDFQLNFPNVGSALTSPGADAQPQSRNANSLLIEDTVNWLRGSHAISIGGSFTQFDIWARNGRLLPRIGFGVLGNDPANGLFSAANFPGSSTDQQNAARNLYALLTGRVTSIGADARLDESGKYVYMGEGLQRGRLREYGIFAQDSWRLKQNLTLNLGLRYDIQQPFYPLNSLYSQANIQQVCGVSGASGDNACNLFQSGNLPGQRPTYDKYDQGAKAHNTDLNNLSPSLGLAWTPTARPGILAPLMGEGDFVVRAGYNRAYSRPGLNDYTGRLGANPGIVIDATRDSGNNLLGAPPLLLRETARLGAPPIPDSPAYPLRPVISDSINTFDPNLQVPSTDSFTAGIQRSLGKNMAVEVRYVRTLSRDNWVNLNYNEFNIVENGFLDEFRKAQANLQANIAAGRGNTFAFTGAPGTVPLPIFLAYYNAQPTANAGNAALYTGTNWTNGTALGFLAARNPNPFGFASTNTTNGLQGNGAFRGNAITAGIPANYFLANPETNGGANVTSNLNKTRYNAVQFEFRRRFAQGLQFNGSYAYGHQYDTVFTSFRRDLYYERPSGNTGDIPHAFKSQVIYDLPFGRGRRFGGNSNAVVDRVIGGWQVGVVSRLQSGTPVNLGNVRLVGMSLDDVKDMFKLRFDNANKQVYMFPEDVIANTILAHNVSATTATGYAGNAPSGRYFAPANGPDCIEIATQNGGYGDCGSRAIVLNGPRFQQHDIRIAKRTTIIGRTNLEFAAQLLNAFNHPNFLAVSGIGNTTLAGYQLTGLQGQEGSRVIQLEVRVNW
jgi:outer membrane receptor protein involved in Fe transport